MYKHIPYEEVHNINTKKVDLPHRVIFMITAVKSIGSYFGVGHYLRTQEQTKTEEIGEPNLACVTAKNPQQYYLVCS